MGTRSRYTPGWFERFFQKIPRKKWGEGRYVLPDGRKCALGLLGVTNAMDGCLEKKLPPAARAFRQMLQDRLGLHPSEVNDGNTPRPLSHPKDRILRAIRKIMKEGV